MNHLDRRGFLHAAGLTSIASSLPSAVVAQAASSQAGSSNAKHEVVPPDARSQQKPKHHIKFAVIGLDHYHIMSMTAAVIRGGGEVVAVCSTNADGLKDKQLADFRQKFGDVKIASSEDEILNDKSIALIAGAPIPDQRAPLGMRVMKAGKDYLSDKPALTTLEQLSEVRKVITETRRKFAIMYSERLEVPAAVKAGELVKSGAIGKVIQTVNLAPHMINNTTRPAWFFDKHRYGGILADIGSHQADQFLYYTDSSTAQVVASQSGNIMHPQYPMFEDFGDMMLSGNGGTGYIRVDWFTPDGLGTWGDGRLFILGSDGYIELRKYVDVANKQGGNHLFIVDKKEARYIDCNNVYLPFGEQFVADIINRTEVAQNQEQALLAAELVLTAQKNATRPVIG
ncbi:MAG: Gfo/Idh/MocA family oxidoreductase [Steroidobacter sp.]